MSNLILRSRATLATQMKNEILNGRMSADEAIKILICYLSREGTITEITLPTPTE